MTAPTQLVQLARTANFATRPPENMTFEQVMLRNGQNMDFLRSQELSESQWQELRTYLANNPEEAAKLADYSTNPDTIRKQASMRAVANVFQRKLDAEDEELRGQMKAFEKDPELATLFEDIRARATDRIQFYLNDEALMSYLCKKLGGVPHEAIGRLDTIRKNPLTLQDACKNGDIGALQQYMAETEACPESRDLESKDHRGVSCLGYAVGANRIYVAQMLLESRANQNEVDLQGNSALHYAAGYGREDMMDILFAAGAEVNNVNRLGQTPLAMAEKNKQLEAAEMLRKKGATL